MFITTAYFIAFILLGIVSASLGPTLPGLAEHTGSQLAQISYLFTARALGYLLGSFFVGRLYDRMKGHILMSLALFFMSIALGLVSFTTLLWMLAPVVALIGVGEGMLDVGGNTLIVWQYGKKVGPFMNGMHFFYGVGAFLSPIIVAQMIVFHQGIPGTYRLFALLVLPLAFWIIRLPSPAPAKDDAVEKSSSSDNGFLVGAIVVFMMLYVGAETGYGNWIYTYGVAKELSEVNAAYLTSVYWVAFTLSRLASVPLGGRVRPRYMLMANFMGAVISLGVIFLWPENQSLIWLGSFGFGFSIAPIFPTILTFAGNRMAISGRVTSYIFLGVTAGGMFLPWFIGQFIEKVGAQFVIQVILVDTFLAVGVFLLIFLRDMRLKVTHP